MDRQFQYLLIRRAAAWCGILLVGCAPLLAQDAEPLPPPAPPEPPHAIPEQGPRPFKGRPGPPPNPLTPQEHARLKEVIDKLPPDIRALLDRNRRRFQKMPEERREVLKNYAMEARERMQGELDRIVLENTSTLPEAERDRFRQRYIEERRSLEKSLREKMDQKRSSALPALLEKLRTEFGIAAAPSPTPESE